MGGFDAVHTPLHCFLLASLHLGQMEAKLKLNPLCRWDSRPLAQGKSLPPPLFCKQWGKKLVSQFYWKELIRQNKNKKGKGKSKTTKLDSQVQKTITTHNSSFQSNCPIYGHFTNIRTYLIGIFCDWYKQKEPIQPTGKILN